MITQAQADKILTKFPGFTPTAQIRHLRAEIPKLTLKEAAHLMEFSSKMIFMGAFNRYAFGSVGINAPSFAGWAMSPSS
jgi:hypothetical protein